MYLKSHWVLFLMPLLVSSCAEVKSTKYKDTSALEVPPAMDIVEKPVAQVKASEAIENKGLGDVVSVADSDNKQVIKIKKIFDRSWSIVEQALKLSEIQITDKNREEGLFYVKFNPSQQRSNKAGLMDSVSSFLFSDGYEEESYKLTVVWRVSDTEVSAELVETEQDDPLDDEKGDFDGPVDSSAKLIKLLFKTIRDDLPID